MIYQTLNHKVNEQALTIVNTRGEQLKIRPKTCQLLLVLLKSANEPISKENLLSQVWPNTVVSEQVVFQSINEIRQLFPNQDAIKTIPQQGYAWLPAVTISQTAQSSLFTKPRVLMASLAVIALTTFYSFVFDAPPEGQPPTAQHKAQGSIIVLPTLNQIEGNDHTWVRLGMMDQVISRLNNSNKHLVLQTDYVLEVLKRADISSTTITADDIRQIFKVSGAELIVHPTLGGSYNDYQLSYVFYYRNGKAAGALLNPNLQTLTDDFTQQIARQLTNQNLNSGPSTNLNSITNPNANQQSHAFYSDFNNELLAAALKSISNGNYELSKSLLTSIVLSDENNLTAHRLLVDSYFRLKQFDQGLERLNIAIPIAEKLNDHTELTRLLFSKSLYFYVTYNDPQSMRIAEQALVIATQNNDWLYMAYLKEQIANIAINQKDYKEAARLVHEAKGYHEVMHCPVGQSASWAKLAQIAKMKGSKSEFHHAIDEAIKITQERELNSQLTYYQDQKSQWL